MPNLRLLKRSRKKAREGDVFVMLPPDGKGYLFGRIIRVNLPHPFPGALLVYVYGVRSEDKTPQRSAMTKENLLLPPVVTNRLGWSHGYFETVANWPLTRFEAYERHCFYSAWRDRYLDEYGKDIGGPLDQPCGEYGLASYLLIDDVISDALGIERTPEDLTGDSRWSVPGSNR